MGVGGLELRTPSHKVLEEGLRWTIHILSLIPSSGELGGGLTKIILYSNKTKEIYFFYICNGHNNSKALTSQFTHYPFTFTTDYTSIVQRLEIKFM